MNVWRILKKLAWISQVAVRSPIQSSLLLFYYLHCRLIIRLICRIHYPLKLIPVFPCCVKTTYLKRQIRDLMFSSLLSGRHILLFLYTQGKRNTVNSPAYVMLWSEVTQFMSMIFGNISPQMSSIHMRSTYFMLIWGPLFYVCFAFHMV